LLDKYFELYHRYNTRHVTPLILEHYSYEREGFRPDEAYQLVANRLATDKHWRQCQAWEQGGLEKKMDVENGHDRIKWLPVEKLIPACKLCAEQTGVYRT